MKGWPVSLLEEVGKWVGFLPYLKIEKQISAGYKRCGTGLQLRHIAGKITATYPTHGPSVSFTEVYLDLFLPVLTDKSHYGKSKRT